MPTGICYWKHDIKLDESFPCYDGKSAGCNHCCVEACPKESPQGFAACARAGHPNWPSVDRGGECRPSSSSWNRTGTTAFFKPCRSKASSSRWDRCTTRRCNLRIASLNPNAATRTTPLPPEACSGAIPAPSTRADLLSRLSRRADRS